MDTDQPLHLAAAVNDIPFIDPSLTDGNEFFRAPEDDAAGDHGRHGADGNGVGVGVGGVDEGEHAEGEEHGEPTQEDINAVIKASLDRAEAQSRVEAAQQAQAQDDEAAAVAAVAAAAVAASGGAGEEAGEADHGAGPDGDEVEMLGQDQRLDSSADDPATGPSAPDTLSHPTPADPPADANAPPVIPGEERSPIPSPPPAPAPFARPDRTDATPNPVHYVFTGRAEFDEWLEGENSWCHFVQRRTTTPDKRSAERLQARIRAYNKTLEAMTPEERALAAPLKTRRRNRVSPVAEKVTFTCHHAGKYESKHSTNLPKEKLRMNTKTSVKCNCASRIVLSEMQNTECRVMYWWRHDGHDPYSVGEVVSGRLPKAIDEWVVAQVEKGKTLDDIRHALSMDEAEKKAYLDKVSADPSAIDADLPPPVALVQKDKFKYSEIYNRYRKLKGPLKEIRSGAGSASRDRSEGGSVGLGGDEGAGAGGSANGVAGPSGAVGKREKGKRKAGAVEDVGTLALAGEATAGNEGLELGMMLDAGIHAADGSAPAHPVEGAPSGAAAAAGAATGRTRATKRQRTAHASPPIFIDPALDPSLADVTADIPHVGADAHAQAGEAGEHEHGHEHGEGAAGEEGQGQGLEALGEMGLEGIHGMEGMDGLDSMDGFVREEDPNHPTDPHAHPATHDHDHANPHPPHPTASSSVENDFASLAATHESLARALLALPSGSGGIRDEELAGMSLEEAMRRLANDVEGSQADMLGMYMK
ncbi:hypothetical protein IAT38_006491 [Cryptococcus sp. DSM 104549]